MEILETIQKKYPERSGKVAYVRYRGGARGEGIIEDNTDGEPARIVIGGGQVPCGVDELLYEMEIGEQRTVVIPSEKAYGEHDPEGVVRYMRSFIRNGEKLKVGDVFAWEHPVSHRQVPVKCIEATEATVMIDFNHLLAGKELEYWFELIDIEDKR